MQNKDKKYFIPVDGNPIEVSEEVYRAYYQPIWNTRYHAQQNGECRCTKAQLWKCDGVCPGCPFYAAGKKVSIDTPIGGEDDELNVSTFTIPKDELYEWADQVLAPTAELSFNGDGEYHCGEWCQFCKAKADCRERANANMELAKFEFRQPPLLTDEEVEEILGRIDELIAWASDIKDYALQAAISGKQWSGYKLIEGPLQPQVHRRECRHRSRDSCRVRPLRTQDSRRHRHDLTSRKETVQRHPWRPDHQASRKTHAGAGQR